MAESEQQQRSLSQAFVKVMRMTELGDQIKGPEVLFLFAKKFDLMFSGDVLNLEHIYHDMLAVNGVEKEVLQGFILIFKDQENNLGVQMQLPAELLLMPARKREALYAKVALQIELRRASASIDEQAPAPAKAKKIVLGGSRKTRRILLSVVVLGLLFVSSVILNLMAEPALKSSLQDVEIDLSTIGLTGRVRHKEGSYLLKIPVAEWDAMPPSVQRSRAKAVFALLKPKGAKNVVVLSDDFRTLAIVTSDSVNLLAREKAAPQKE